ncbi:hypothetical protein ACFQMM_01185 [Saliphagus sp. GCM10025308]
MTTNDTDEDIANALTFVIGRMQESSRSLDSRNNDIFEECLNLLDDGGIINKINKNKYPQWLEVASIIGDSALDEILDTRSVFMRRDKQPFLQQLSKVATQYDHEIVDRILELEISELSNDPLRSSQRVSNIFKDDVVMKSNKAPDYLLKLVENWDFDNRDQGPNKSIFVDEVVGKLHKEEYSEEAEKIYSTSVPHGLEFKKDLYDLKWPGAHF